MELTGKCKVDFEKWYIKNVFRIFSIVYIDQFYRSPLSMQYGVFLDFLDTVDINVETFRNRFNRFRFYFEVDYGKPIEVEELGLMDLPNTRDERRVNVIESANELYNKIYETSNE